MRFGALVIGCTACSFTPGTLTRDGDIDGDIVGDDAANGGDAAPLDSGFDPATDCPGTYNVMLAATAAISRYRIVTTLDVYWPHDALCRADRPGATHPVSLQTQQEIVDLTLYLDTTQTLDRYYVGGVQQPDATTPAGGWVAFDGTDHVQTAWHTPENEPDDGGDTIENQGQQLMILDRLLEYLHDATGVSAYGVVCECDGIPVHPKADVYVTQDPNNPN
jgi:hypothetical protein